MSRTPRPDRRHRRPFLRRVAALAAAALAVPATALGVAPPATAASSDSCRGGGFSVVDTRTGATVLSANGGEIERSVPAAALGERFGIRGRYVEFDVRTSDFAVLDYVFTGAANPADMTGGVRTPVWASKVPDHRGLALTSAVTVELDGEELVVQRSGPGLAMKVQAKDCAQGGIFQMEPERGDRSTTRIVHTLASGGATAPFYFDNPRFRARQGQFLGADCQNVVTGPPSRFCVQVEPRVNIANDVSPKFVARDSAQVAERVPHPACNTAAPRTPSVEHCGRVTVWDVASGGRMGFVTGEDSVEVANPPTECVRKCQAQNRTRGRLAVLGFPFPVPAGDRLVPAAP